jgi:Protein of unknown function (DUF429)
MFSHLGSSSPSYCLFGVDFSSSPTRRKPITVAKGRLASLRGQPAVCLESLLKIPSLESFKEWLNTRGPWLAAFDFPFALPLEFLRINGWPHASWQAHIEHFAQLTRPEMVVHFKAFCDARPVGEKFAHRACDRLSGSSPSMKWVNPPVAYMLHAGAPRLLAAGVHIPMLNAGDTSRIALEAYPGYFARTVVGRNSYKSDDRAKQNVERLEQRKRIVAAIEDGRNNLSLAGQFDATLREQCLEDASGDTLDACICLMQAAWGWQRREANFGLPLQTDALEGWIVSVPQEVNLEMNLEVNPAP